MSNPSASSILLEARKEVEGHVHEYLAIPVRNAFEDIYARAMRKDGTLITFQRMLQEVPSWTSLVVSQHCDRVRLRCDFIQELMMALFLSHVRIMSSIKIAKDTNVKIKVPKLERFLHAVFIDVARHLYEQPTVIRHGRGWEILEKMVMEAVDRCVRSMLPIKDILGAYLANNTTAMGELRDDGREMETPPPLPRGSRGRARNPESSEGVRGRRRPAYSGRGWRRRQQRGARRRRGRRGNRRNRRRGRTRT